MDTTVDHQILKLISHKHSWNINSLILFVLHYYNMTRFNSKQTAISTLDNKVYSLTEHVQLFYGW